MFCHLILQKEFYAMNTQRVYLILLQLSIVESAKVLGVFPTPSFSHQVVFRTLMLELAKRGHQVTVITPRPISHNLTENYTEIDVQNDLKAWRNIPNQTGDIDNIYNEVIARIKFSPSTFYENLETDEVRKIIDDKSISFDMIIIESWFRVTLGFAHRFDVPIIKFGTLGGVLNEYDIIGGTDHPVLYLSPFTKKIGNLTFWEQITEVYIRWSILIEHKLLEDDENENLRRFFGSDMPTLSELSNKVSAVMLNIHRVWEMYRPSPLNLITVGGIHIRAGEDLPNDLKLYLDSSVYGVIYISFGSNCKTSFLPPKQVEAMVNVFSRLPYDILWKCSEDELPRRPSNIKTLYWMPQQDLLKHPNIKLFVTQGGLQSVDEAMAGGVPLLGIPAAVDQYYNVENIVRLKIGLQLPMQTFTEQDFEDKVTTLIKDGRYRNNVVQLRDLLYDTPQSPLQRAVWWTEHVLQHGARHLRAPAHNMHWTEYLEIELLGIVLISFILFTILNVLIVINISRLMLKICIYFRFQVFLIKQHIQK